MDTEVSLTRLYSDTGQYLDQEVDVACRLLQDRELPDELLVCYRFRSTCCTADTLTAGKGPSFPFLLQNRTNGWQHETTLQ